MVCEQLLARRGRPRSEPQRSLDRRLAANASVAPVVRSSVPGNAYAELRLLRPRHRRGRFFVGFTICHMQKSLICQRISGRQAKVVGMAQRLEIDMVNFLYM